MDPDVAKMDICTICPSFPLICSRIDGSECMFTLIVGLFLVGLKMAKVLVI